MLEGAIIKTICICMSLQTVKYVSEFRGRLLAHGNFGAPSTDLLIHMKLS